VFSMPGMATTAWRTRPRRYPAPVSHISVSLSSLEMTGRHASAMCCSVFPSARQLT